MSAANRDLEQALSYLSPRVGMSLSYEIMAPDLPEEFWQELTFDHWLEISGRLGQDQSGRTLKEKARERLLALAKSGVDWNRLFWSFAESVSDRKLVLEKLVQCNDLPTDNFLSVWTNIFSLADYSAEIKSSLLTQALRMAKTFTNYGTICNFVRGRDETMFATATQKARASLMSVESCIEALNFSDFLTDAVEVMSGLNFTPTQWLTLARCGQVRRPEVFDMVKARGRAIVAKPEQWIIAGSTPFLDGDLRFIMEENMLANSTTLSDYIVVYQCAHNEAIKSSACAGAVALARSSGGVDDLMLVLKTMCSREAEMTELSMQLVQAVGDLTTAVRIYNFVRTYESARIILAEKIRQWAQKS